MGATASLQVAPYYNKPTQQGIYQHFAAIAEKTDFPLIIYNIQGRTGQNITTLTMEQLAELEQVVGVKEASGNIPQVMDVIAKTHGIDVLSGDDNLALPHYAVGRNRCHFCRLEFYTEKSDATYRICESGEGGSGTKITLCTLAIFQSDLYRNKPHSNQARTGSRRESGGSISSSALCDER